MALQAFSYFLVLFLLRAVARGQEDTTEKALDIAFLSAVAGSDHSMVERTCLDTLRIGYDSQLTTEHPVHIGSNCSDLCIGPEGPVSEGKFPHPGDCRAYIHCQNWEAEAVLCPDFHYFDTTTHECVQAAADDETRREQCKLRVFTTKSPTTTEATLTTREDLATIEAFSSTTIVTGEPLHKENEEHTTVLPATPPESMMKGVVVKVKPATSTQFVNPTITTSTPSTVLIVEPGQLTTESISTTTTEESKTGSSSTVIEKSTTRSISITTEEPTTRSTLTTTAESTSRTSTATLLTTAQLTAQASQTTGKMVKATTSPFLLLLAESSSARTTVSQLPVTTTSDQPRASTSAPLTTTSETSILVAGKIPEFKRSRYYLPGTLYRPPVIQRPKKP